MGSSVGGLRHPWLGRTPEHCGQVGTPWAVLQAVWMVDSLDEDTKSTMNSRDCKNESGKGQGGRGSSGEPGQGANSRAPPFMSLSQVVSSGSSVKFLPSLKFCGAQDPRHQKLVATLASKFNWTCPGPSLGLTSFPCSYFKAPLFPLIFISSPEGCVKLISVPPHSSQAPTLLQLLKVAAVLRSQGLTLFYLLMFPENTRASCSPRVS